MSSDPAPHQPQTLATSPPTPTGTPDTAATGTPGVAEGIASLAGRYRLEGEIGRGGMGVVYRAFDPDCQRTLAVKVLQERYRDNPDLPSRFLEEARLTAQLQHPGVPPVHDIGRLPDGRPFFAMKLVKGRTLAELLKEGGSPEWLAVFEAVCQTIAYVHSRGVIHRDLKPSNVMVGAFGEVQVMDWGLAKVIARGGEPQATAPSETSTIYSARSSESGTHTHTGDILGTPAYMAPEQARGETVDERADVFGLGAVLCAILTSAPPFNSPAEVALRRAREADLAEAYTRLEECGADAELIALAKRCLSAEPGLRPRDGRTVADAVAMYQAGVRERLRQAELAAVEARRQAEVARERTRRRLTVAAGVVAVGAVVGVGALWSYWQAQARTASADQAAGVAMDEARRLWEKARAEMPADRGTYAAAVAAASKSEELAKAGPGSLDTQRQTADLRARVEADRDASVKDRRLLAAVLDVVLPQETTFYRRDKSGKVMALAMPSRDEQCAAAFRAWGLDVDATPTGDAVALLKARPPAVVAEVVAALDAWAEERRARGTHGPQAALAAELDGASAGSWRRELREIQDRNRLSRERVLGEVSAALLPWAELSGLTHGPDRNRLRELLRQVDVRTEPVLAVLTLARALVRTGDWRETEQLLRQAVLARPAEPALQQALGAVWTQTRPPSWAGAIEYYQAARALRPELGTGLAQALVEAGRVAEGEALLGAMRREQPDNPALLLRLGQILFNQGRFGQAEAAVREVIRLQPEYAEAYSNLGVTLKAQGKYEEAEAACRRAIRLKPVFPQAHLNLGLTLDAWAKYEEAEPAFREAIRLQPDSGQAHFGLAVTLAQQHRHKEAEAAYRDAIRLKPDSAAAHSGLGGTLAELGRHKEAEAAGREALRLEPGDADAHVNLGNALIGQKQWLGAEAAYRQAINLEPGAANAHANLGNALYNQGKAREAEAACREAIRLKTDFSYGHSMLGTALAGQGKSEEAAEAFRKAIIHKPDAPIAHYNLGNLLSGQGKPKEAEAAFRQAIKIKPDFVGAHYNLGAILCNQGKPKEGEAAYREAIRIQPDYPQAHVYLGEALREQGRFDEALASLKRGHELGSKVAGWPYPSAQMLRDCERLIALDRKWPAVLVGNEVVTDAGERIELAALCQQYKNRPAAAARLYAASLAADPRLAADLPRQLRHSAARAAVLASAGRGEDGPLVSDKEGGLLSRIAPRCLRAYLDAYAKLLPAANDATRKAAGQRLAHWLQDAALASVRDRDALAALPETERAEWEKLWADVADLLKQAGAGDTK